MLSTSEFNRVLSSLKNNLNITHTQAHHLTIAISQTACADWSVVTLQSEGQFKEFMCSFRVHDGELQMTTLYYCQVKDNSSLWSVPVTRTATAPAATTKPAEDHYLVFNPTAEAVYYFAAVEQAPAPAAPEQAQAWYQIDNPCFEHNFYTKRSEIIAMFARDAGARVVEYRAKDAEIDGLFGELYALSGRIEKPALLRLEIVDALRGMGVPVKRVRMKSNAKAHAVEVILEGSAPAPNTYKENAQAPRR